MTKAPLGGISPFFIVKDIATAFAFYCDKLGFAVTYQAEDGDLFFGIVQRGNARIFLKSIGVEPMPNNTREVGEGTAPWDAYVYVPDPDALAGEFASRNVVFLVSLSNNTDGLRGFEIADADGYVLYFGRPLSSET